MAETLDEMLEPIWQEVDSATAVYWKRVFIFAAILVVDLIAFFALYFLEILTVEFLWHRAISLFLLIAPIVCIAVNIRVILRGEKVFFDKASRLGLDDEIVGEWWARRH